MMRMAGLFCLRNPCASLVAALLLTLPAMADTFVSMGSSWKYMANGSDQGSAWRATNFVDAAWSNGTALLGFGDPDIITALPSGHVTYYFRKSFSVTSAASVTSLLFRAWFDDGAIVYLNGTEVWRYYMTNGTVTYQTLALVGIGGPTETQWQEVAVSPSLLVEGPNTIAVEVHQVDVASSDVRFELEASGNRTTGGGQSAGLLPLSATWKYHDNGISLGSTWRESSYVEDGNWDSGVGMFGYGDPGMTTTVSYGADANNKYPTCYFRHTLGISNAAALETVRLYCQLDDGAVVYVNGQEVWRHLMPSGEPSYSTYATGASEPEDAWHEFTVSPSLFVNGNNIVAAEIHQVSAGSSDFRFHLWATNETGGVGSPGTGTGWQTNAISLTFTGSDPRQNSPSSRRTWLTISEIMYDPPAAYGQGLEFVELYNPEPIPLEIGGYRLAGDIAYTFPAGMIITGQTRRVIARNPALVASTYGLSGVLGPFSGGLPNSSGAVELYNDLGARLLEALYSSKHPWPAAAAGAGHSLVLAKPDFGEGDVRAWSVSAAIRGNPGLVNPSITNLPQTNIVINEVLSHTDPPLVDFIELYNRGASSVSLAGCYLTDDPDNLLFQISGGTTLGAGQCLAFTATQLGFNLSMSGDTVYLIDPAGNVILDAFTYSPQENGISCGRYPDGAPTYSELQAVTQGSTNRGTSIKTRDIVITEIMYNPISGNDDDEYIELYNKSPSPVDLSYWRFTAGIDFMFPPGTTLAAGGYLAIARSSVRLMATHSNLNAGNCIGDYDGTLSDGGERVSLAKPDDPQLPYQDFVVVDEVTYSDGWGQWSDGGGSSLELRDPRSDNRLERNWTSSDETGKSQWTSFEGLGDGQDSPFLDYGGNEVHLGLEDAGECLIDDIEVIRNGGNVFSQGSFESGLDGSWRLSGTHDKSGIENAGYNSSKSLHVRAENRHDFYANKIERDIDGNPITGGEGYPNIQLKYKARWLAGSPIIWARVHTCVEAVGQMAVPSNLGSPGVQNSRHAANVGPAIADTLHAPVLPAAGQSCIVSTRLHDPDGVQAAVLFWRTEGSGSFTSNAMNDSGSSGDAHAGDGVWSASIPGQGGNTTVEFYIRATDGSVTNLFPATYPENVGLVMFGQGEPGGAFKSTRIWTTQNTISEWINRTSMDNSLLDCTVVYGGTRVIYGAGVRYKSSIYTRTTVWESSGTDHPELYLQGYVFHTPSDNPLLGGSRFTLDFLDGGGGTFQSEQFQYWSANKLGLSTCPEQYTHVYINEYRKGIIYASVLQPSAEYLDTWFPDDSKGDLYETSAVDFCNDDYSGYVRMGNSFSVRTHSDGTPRTVWYRQQEQIRANSGTDYDMFPIHNLLTNIHQSVSDSMYTNLSTLIDVDQWARNCAIRCMSGDWDGFGFSDKNGYLYKPTRNRWKIVLWDMDLFGDYGRFGGGTGYSIWTALHPTFTTNIIAHNEAKRAYVRACAELVDGPYSYTQSRWFMNTYYAALQNNSVSAATPFDANAWRVQSSETWYGGAGLSMAGWIDDRRNSVSSQIQSYTNVAFALGTGNFTAGSTPTSISGTAPVKATIITLNGVPQKLRWTSITGWTAMVGLSNGVNSLRFEAFDRLGAAVGSAQTIQVTYNGSAGTPEADLVINEIMYNSSTEGANYIELFNRSASVTYDLRGYRLNGADFVFDGGSLVGPGSYVLLVENRSIFNALFGKAANILGEYAGSLDNDGETLSIQRPVITGAVTNWQTIDTVRYDDDAPWPSPADGAGAALQLIDAAEDNNRIGNWGVPSGAWQYVTQTGVATTESFYLYTTTAGDMYVDGVALVQGAVPEAGANLLVNGGFEGGLNGWTVDANMSGSYTTMSSAMEGSSSLHLFASTGGSGGGTSIRQVVPVTTGQTYTLSYWCKPGSAAVTFVARFSGSWITTTVSLSPGGVLYTPGASNSVCRNLASFPSVWINEVLASNVVGQTDNMGEREPWVELLNKGSTVDLNSGAYYLSDNYSDLDRWAFPAGWSIASNGRLLVWADAETGETQAGIALHAGFELNAAGGSVALCRMDGGQPVIIDYLNYGNLGSDRSYGSFPEGDSWSRQAFDTPTAGTSNSTMASAVSIHINEWMASQTASGAILADPADGDFEDWFELYNSGQDSVNLADYTLTDNPASTNNWRVPSGTVIPAGGHLLIWADNDTGQNAPGQLHAGFQLGAGGEAIALYSPAGSLVDMVSFGVQEANISEGRHADGADDIFAMPIPTPGTTNTLFMINTVASTSGAVRLNFNTRPNRDYTVLYRESISGVGWQTHTNLQANGGSTSVTINASSRTRFFKIVQD